MMTYAKMRQQCKNCEEHGLCQLHAYLDWVLALGKKKDDGLSGAKAMTVFAIGVFIWIILTRR